MSVKRVFGRGDLTSIVRLLVVVAGAVVTLWVLAAAGALDSNDSPAWVTAVGTVGLVIVAGAALRSAASQVKEAARASTESHRPYVTLMTRPSTEGFLYLDLVNHGDRAALDVSVDLSSPPLVNVKNTEKPATPFGRVSYLAPSERRSVMYASSRDANNLPRELIVEITYSGEDDKLHKATVTHDLDALKLILTNPENKKSPQRLFTEGLNRFERIVNAAVREVTEKAGPHKRPRLKGSLSRLTARLRGARAPEHS